MISLGVVDPRPLLLLPLVGLGWLILRLAGRRGLGLRALTLTLLLIAASQPFLGRSGRPPPVLLAVEADHARGELLTRLGDLARRHQRLVPLVFGRDVRPLEEADRAGQGIPSLGAPLDFAGRFFPAGGTLVLLTSGRTLDLPSVPAGLRVLVWPLDGGPLPEAAIAALEAPTSVWQGERFPVQVEVESSRSGPAVLEVWAGQELLGQETVELQEGRQRFGLVASGSVPGLVTLRAELQADWDGRPENDLGLGAVVVHALPRLLLVGQAAPAFESRLRQQGFALDVVPPEGLSPSLPYLAGYGAIVLNDVDAERLSLEQAAALRAFVADLGRGLLVAGGRSSFALGHYQESRLEALLPVRAEPPPQEEVPPLAMVIILDRSASMGRHATLSKMALAREAAILATELLRPEDRIGVLVFNTSSEWVVPIRRVGEGLELGRIQDEIATITAGGGTDIRGALREGFSGLIEVEGAIKHVVLLTDGQDFSRRMDVYQDLLGTARAAGITTSALAMGGDADVELLSNIADWGQGRYYFAARPEDIPRLTLEESNVITRLAVREGGFQVALEEPHPALRGFAPAELPPLGGYVATTPREEARVALASPIEDPILAFRRVGLGQTAAWLSDLGGEWSAAWTAWERAGPFWAQVVLAILPRPGSDLLEGQVAVGEGRAEVEVRAWTDAGEPVDLAPPAGVLERPEGGWQPIELAQVGAGRYRRVLRDLEPGTYVLRLVQRREEGTVELSLPFAYAYPAAQGLPSRAPGLLEELAAASGGVMVGGPEDLEPFLEEEAPAGLRELWPSLLLLAGLSLLAEAKLGTRWNVPGRHRPSPEEAP